MSFTKREGPALEACVRACVWVSVRGLPREGVGLCAFALSSPHSIPGTSAKNTIGCPTLCSLFLSFPAVHSSACLPVCPFLPWSYACLEWPSRAHRPSLHFIPVSSLVFPPIAYATYCTATSPILLSQKPWHPLSTRPRLRPRHLSSAPRGVCFPPSPPFALRRGLRQGGTLGNWALRGAGDGCGGGGGDMEMIFAGEAVGG